MTTTEHTTRPKATQHTHGEAVYDLPSAVPFLLNGKASVSSEFTKLETQEEQRGWFDAFVQHQQRQFPTAWVAIYEALDLIRIADWYWKDQGYDSFEDWWKVKGEHVYGTWAELESTYNYAKLAAPHLFDVEYDQARNMAQQLARFRDVAPAGKQVGNGSNKHTKSKKRAHVISSNPVDPADYIPELNPPQWQEGVERGQRAGHKPEDSIRRFARLRRDAPEVAQQFLAGEYVRSFKNGKVEPDLVAAEVAGGVRKKGEAVRKRDPLTHIKRLAKGLNAEQLKAVVRHCQQVLDSMEAT